MSAATEQNNGDVAVEKVAAATDAVDTAAVKEDLKEALKPAVEEKASADNGTAGKDAAAEEEDAAEADAASPVKEHVKGTKRPAEAKSAESKKAKKEKTAAAAADGDSDDEEALEDIIEEDSEIESDEYDINYGGEDEIECDDDDDENDDGSGSDDQA